MNHRERREAKQLLLPEYYDRYHLPQFQAEAAAGTLKSYRESLAHWQRVTNNPRLSDCDSSLLASFKAALFNPQVFRRKSGVKAPQMSLFDMAPPAAELNGRRPLSRATTNKHLRQIAAIFNKAGPAGPKNRDALGILDFVPWTKPLREYRRLPRDVPDEILSAIYRATAAAEFPRLDGVTAADWWKALLASALILGFRRGGLLALRQSDVDWQRAEIRLEAEADKCREERVKPIGQLVLRHLLRIRTADELLFPWPHSERTFYRQWHRIQDAAGVKQQVTVHDLKRACGSRFSRIASPWVVQRRLDHSSVATSQRYVNASEEETRAVERIPLPAAFLEEFGQGGIGDRGLGIGD